MPTAHEKAIAELQRSLTADPKDTRALLRIAELRAKTGQPAMACAAWALAADVFLERGFVRRALSSLVQGLDVAKKGRLIERIPALARGVANLYVAEKLPREAVATLDGAVSFLFDTGADADGAALLEERIAVEESEAARVRFAEALYRLDQPARATAQLEAVFARLSAQRRCDEALEVAERLLGSRCDVRIARAAAEMYLERARRGDPWLALAKLRVACASDATHLPTLDLLARAFDQAGHADKARRVRDEMARLEGREPLAGVAPVASVSPAEATGEEAALARDVDAGWDAVGAEPAAALDPSRASFWPVEEGGAPDASGSVLSVTITDVELVDEPAPSSETRPVSIFEAALECIESLVAQGRLDEALAMVGHHLTLRPRNALLLERKAEIEDLARRELPPGPPGALYGFPYRGAASARSRAAGGR